jgi:hypothetical protein
MDINIGYSSGEFRGSEALSLSLVYFMPGKEPLDVIRAICFNLSRNSLVTLA